MTLRRVTWSVMALVTLVALALLIPASPAYLPTLMLRYGHLHDGHGTGYWVDALKSPDTETRRHAIFSLGMIGPEGEDAVPALADIMLKDPDNELRGEASLALSKMTPASRTAVPALAQALGDNDPVVRMNAASTLFRLKDESRPAVPALIEALNAEENQVMLAAFYMSVQEMMALALGRASAGTSEGVPALIDALRTAGTDRVRRAVVRALGFVGKHAREAAPQIAALRQHEDSDMRRVAEVALRAIGAESEARE